MKLFVWQKKPLKGLKMDKISGLIDNSRCPRCKKKGEAIDSVYRNIRAPGWRCKRCGYVWFKYKDLQNRGNDDS